MGVFERVMDERQAGGEPLELSPSYAFAAIVVGACNVDGRNAPEEMQRANDVFASTKLFKQPGCEPVATIVESVLGLCQTQGVDRVAALAARSLPQDLRLPTFANAVDLVLADGQATGEERRFIDELQARLHVSDEDARKIVDVIIVKNGI